MKKLLSIIGTISLITGGSSNLIACNNNQLTSEKLTELKEKNNKTINGNKLEWMAPQEKPFNALDDKWYVVIWRGKENLEWKIFKLKNDEKIRLKNGFKLVLDYYGKVDDPNKINLVFDAEINNLRANDQIWTNNSINFKSVYRWDGNSESNTPKIDNNGNIID